MCTREVAKMSYIIYLKKDDDHVYAYQATSYRDPVTRKPKSKRVYIGRVDPITHEFLNPEDKKKLQPLTSTAKKNDSHTEGKTVTSNEIVSEKELNKINKTLQTQQLAINSIQKEQKEIRRLFETIGRAIHLSTSQD